VIFSKQCSGLIRLIAAFISSLLLCGISFAATVNTRALTHKPKSSKVVESERARKRMRRLTVAHATRTRKATLRRASLHRRHRYYERFTGHSFVSDDITDGDLTAGEDPVVRQAAIDALGNMNGTVVAIQPTSGRILAMVNQ
jgi:membrane carboxypeptidase/penicillin-binding protein